MFYSFVLTLIERSFSALISRQLGVSYSDVSPLLLFSSGVYWSNNLLFCSRRVFT